MSKVAGKKDLVELVAKEAGVAKTTAEEQVNTVLNCMSDLIVDGGICLKGKFTIKTKIQKGRDGAINGVAYHTEDKTTLKITVGSEMEETLNK